MSVADQYRAREDLADVLRKLIRLTVRRYCGEGKDPRFGVIDFAISADVTEAFRAAVLQTKETEWKPLIRMFDGKPQQTDQEWAEVCFVPHWAGYSKNRADYRFLAIREPLRQERRSAFRHEERPRWRATPVRAVRCECRLVGTYDPGAQSERSGEAAGTR